MSSKRLKIYGLLLLSIWTSAGCATVTGRTQVVSIDSEPRGAKVYLKGEPTPIGTTPFFYKLDRIPEDTLVYQPEAGRLHAHKFKCEYRWWLESFGNGPLALLSPGAALVAFGVDYITGAAFECPSAIAAKIPDAKVTPYRAAYCRKYLVVPPFHFDEKISDEIAAIWMDQAMKGLRGCDDFIDFDAGKSSLQRLDITNRRKMTVEDFRRARINYVGLVTGVTDLVILDYAQEGSVLTVQPTVLDVHSWKKRSVDDFKVVIRDAQRFDVSDNERYFLYTFRFIPNSVTYGYQATSQLILPASGKVITKIHNEKNLPSYISNWNMVSVEHPDAFDSWDVGFDFYPSLSFIYKKQDLTIRDLDRDVTTSREHTLVHVLPAYNASMSLHTAIGAFTLAVGGGLSQHFLSVTGGERFYAMNIFRNHEISYTGFFMQDMFYRLSTGQTWFSGRQYSDEYYRIDPQVHFVSASIGYYIPQLRRFARSFY